MTRTEREGELRELMRTEGVQAKIVDLYEVTLGNAPLVKKPLPLG